MKKKQQQQQQQKPQKHRDKKQRLENAYFKKSKKISSIPKKDNKAWIQIPSLQSKKFVFLDKNDSHPVRGLS